MSKKKIIILIGCLVFILLVGIIIIVVSNKEETKESNFVVDNKISYGNVNIDFGENKISDGSASLSISKALNHEIENGLINELFILEVDASCKSEIKVSLLMDQTLNDNVLLGIGLDYTIESNEMERMYSHYETTINNNIITASFVPADFAYENMYLGASGKATSSSNTGKLKLYLGYFTDGCYYENGHFKLWYPSGYVMTNEFKTEVLNILEIMRTYYSDMAYNVGSNDYV